jgi:hypothetical protein
MEMAKENTPPKEPTPFEKFTEAAKRVFNLPKDQVRQTIEKYPHPRQPRKSKKKK